MSVSKKMGHPPDIPVVFHGDIPFMLRLAYTAVFNNLLTTFKSHGLRPGEFAILRIIESEPGIRQGQIGTVLRQKVPNLVTMVTSLEERSLITKARDQMDLRAYGLALTEAGAEVLAAAVEAQQRVNRRVESILSDAERPLLIELLQRLSRFDEQTDESLDQQSK